MCLNGDYLFLADWGADAVRRYDGSSGEFVDTFVARHSGGINQPFGIVIGPHDGNLYVSTGEFGGPGQLKAVLRYDGNTGEFMDNFAVGGDLKSPRGIIFGPDGNLYVADRAGGSGPGRIARFDGKTGAFIDDFVPLGSNGLGSVLGLVFGRSVENSRRLDLYVASPATDSIQRYHGETGAFLGHFVPSGSGGLDVPVGLTFGPDGDLYVAESSLLSNAPASVLRFQGPADRTPGTFVGTFVPASSGGLQTPLGLIFGPDGNGDSRQDLYVSNSEVNGYSLNGKNANVKRYDGVTGAFIDTFVSERSGGLDDAAFLTFTETDPVTLAYMGGSRVADVASPEPVNDILSHDHVQSIMAQALPYWQNRGVDTLNLRGIDLRIDDLLGHSLGKDIGNTIRIDANTADFGGSIQAPAEAKRTDLLSAPSHEVEHLLGLDDRDDPTVMVGESQIVLRLISEIDFQDLLGSLHQPLGVRETS